MTIKNKKIAVALGGWNKEKEVSINSGESVYKTLIDNGFNAMKVEFDRNFADKIKNLNIDIVFNALHGKFVEDGRIQGLLDFMQIPYTHSGLSSSAVCMDKVFTHKICSDSGAKTAKYHIIRQGEDAINQEKINELGRPFVIKPINEGSSVGIEIILSDNNDFDISKYQFNYGKEMIIEKYIAGKEIQVAIFDNYNIEDDFHHKLFNIFCNNYQKYHSTNIDISDLKSIFAKKKSIAIGAIEVRPKNLFYDYQCKYTPGMTEYVMPAEISQKEYYQILEIAENCYNSAKCRGLARIDFILNDKNYQNNIADNSFYLLEINTHPGFTSTSLVPKIAKYHNIEFIEIIQFLLNNSSYDD